MSIICDIDGFGWILDHQAQIDEEFVSVSSGHNEGQINEANLILSKRRYKCLPKLFHVIHKYVMDSEFTALQQRLVAKTTQHEVPDEDKVKNRKKV